MPSKAVAEAVARNFNAVWERYGAEGGHDVRAVAHAEPWMHGKEAHTKDIREHFYEYADLVLDEDAARFKSAQPVEAVDMRTAFEKWAGAKGYALHIRDMKGSTRLGEYGYADTQRLWEAWQDALAHPRSTGEEAFIIKYEDADEPDEVFYGHGARGAAFKRYAQRSTAWSAHLFQRIDCNTSRGDTTGEQAGEMGITSAVDKARENTMIFGRTGGNMFSLIDRQLGAIHHSDEAQKKALGIDDSVKEEEKTYRGTLIKALKELETTSVRLGAVVIPLLVKGLNFVTPLIERLATWIGNNSTLTKGIVIVFGALAGLAVVGGTLLAVGGAFTLIAGAVAAGGGLAVMLGGVATALGAIAAVAAGIAFGVGAGTWLNGHAINPLVNKLSGGKYKSLGDAAAGDGSNLTDGSSAGGKHDLRFENYVDGKWGPKPNLVKPGTRSGSAGGVGDVYLDGKKVGKALAPHLANQLSAPQRGSNSFDMTVSPTPVGMTTAH
jgi:hypothetical protein